ncbi:deleted in malignant brain tumors 1 protein-like [Stegostoma tigrinum]|uniref:deleted in malignant brain tumors 1 protein-like n=1 Tax=Stegostoma tigrinum TaxID=3053191 RepID=UPI0028700666|nr:deleted in malignant brain tumors 1 protein-like [Stegostoma tigrinum]
MGCGYALETHNSSKYGESDSRSWLLGVQCHGQEPHLQNCSTFELLNCSSTHSSGVGIICSEHLQLRLSNGGSPCAGRVEIYYNRTWGSVCDDSWDMVDAQVVCKQLGCGDALDMTLPSSYGLGSVPVLLKDVKCSGNETFLWECPSARLGQQDDCSHKEDVRIICTEHKAMRLVNGKHRCEGRVEVFYNGTWGTVCSDKMNSVNGNIICKHLHCGAFQDIEDDIKSFGAGTGQIWLDEIQCLSHESKLWQCQADLWGQHDCNHREDAGVVCSEIDERIEQPLSSNSCIQNSDSQNTLLLVGGNSNCSGRVEIMCDERWGTLCGDSWDMSDANVVCRQLPCGFAVSAQGEPAVSQGQESESSSIPVVVCLTLGVLFIFDLIALLLVMQRKLRMKDRYAAATGSSLGLYQGIYEEIEDIPLGAKSVQKHGIYFLVHRNSASVDSHNGIEYYTKHTVSDHNPESPNPEVKSNASLNFTVTLSMNTLALNYTSLKREFEVNLLLWKTKSFQIDQRAPLTDVVDQAKILVDFRRLMGTAFFDRWELKCSAQGP